MAIKLELVFLAVVLLQVTVSSPVTPSSSGAKSVLEDREPLVGLYGGHNITIKKAKYVGAVTDFYGMKLGTAVILNNQWVLTTAFTVDKYPAHLLKVRVGSSDSTRGGKLVSVKDIFIPSDYQDMWDYDIALLKLKNSLKFSATVGSVKLPNSILPKEGTMGVISGYGYSKKSTGGYLQQLSLPISNYTTCKPKLPGTFSGLSFCTMVDGAGPCTYDWGSPLIFESTVVGIFLDNGDSSGCGKASNPSVFAYVYAYSTWLEKTIRSNTVSGEILEHSEDVDEF